MLRASHEEAHKHLNDDTKFIDGRRRLAAEAVAAGKAAASETLSNAETLADVGFKLLVAESAPSLGDTTAKVNGALSQAKHDIRLVAETAEDNGTLTERLKTLAAMDGPINTVVTGEFLDLLLMSRGISGSERDAIATAVRETALQARARRSVPAAVLALKVRGRMRGAIGSAKALANHQF